MGKISRAAVRKFELLTGIEERHVCSQGEDSFTLARDAAANCLNRSQYSPEDLDMILCCSISKHRGDHSYQYEPPFSILIKDAIGAKNAINFDVTNACAGMLTGVYIAEDFLQRGAIRSCMVVSGESISNLGDHTTMNTRTLLSSELASLTVGDAGAAVILESVSDNRKGITVSNFTTLPEYNHLCTARQNQTYPGFTMKTKAREIHRVWIEKSSRLIGKALQSSGLSLDQIDYIIPHQTSRSSITAATEHYADYFRVEPRRMLSNLQQFGNTASTTHFLALNRYLKEGFFKQGDQIMMLCSASGLIFGVVLFTIDEIMERYEHED